ILNSVYFEKQRKFVALIKEIQNSLNSKEYKNQGYTFNEYIKIKWNISQAQAYRYLLCGRVLDQLEEFEIKPSYERLCKALATVAKTPIQMKILWSAILKKTGGRPDCVNSTHVNNIWKEICSNKNYSDICKYEGDIMNKIEKSLSKFENEKKHKLSKTVFQTSPLSNNSICSSSSSSSSSISSISFQNMPSSLSNSSIQNLSSIPHDSIYNSNSSLSNHSNITISSLPNI
ncbi:hypothetical protein U3516DRAFT_872267, partial [Neocallimastix sp. 'constans']